MNKLSLKIIFIILTFAILTNLYAADNNQYILAVDDDNNIMDIMQNLYIDSQMALPSSSGPWSVAELNLMFSQIKKDKLNNKSLEQYVFLENYLNSYSKDATDDLIISFSPEVSYESYYHRNTNHFTTRNSWNRGWDEQKPFVTTSLDLMVNDFAYAFVNLNIGVAENQYSRYISKGIDFGKKKFATNIPFVAPNYAMNLNTDISDRSFVAIGGHNWSAQIGRDQLSWGNGVSSNFLVSDNIEYQNFIRLTFFGKTVKYTFLSSFFPHQLNYVKTDGYDVVNSQAQPLIGFSMFSAHRFEGRILDDRLGWSFSEGNMFASDKGFVDFAAFNPLLSYHSLYYKANCNSIVSASLDLTISNYFNIYSEAVIDDLVFPIGESKNNKWSPDAYGLMFGVKYVNSDDYYKRLSSIELAYTSPYLYLRNAGNVDTIQDGYGINYIVALRKFTQDGISFNKKFLGYKYGGDAIVINIHDKLYDKNEWSFETNLFLMIHGAFDINTLWSPVGTTSDVRKDVSTPTSTDYISTKKNIPSLTSILGFNYTNKMINHISLFGQIDFILINNPGNIYTKNTTNYVKDIQISVGVTLKY